MYDKPQAEQSWRHALRAALVTVLAPLVVLDAILITYHAYAPESYHANDTVVGVLLYAAIALIPIAYAIAWGRYVRALYRPFHTPHMDGTTPAATETTAPAPPAPFEPLS